MPLMRNQGLFEHPILVDIAERYSKTPAQIVALDLAHNRLIIPKSKHLNVLKKIMIFDFSLE